MATMGQRFKGVNGRFHLIRPDNRFQAKGLTSFDLLAIFDMA
jgi:hypothetical protein